MVGHRSLLVGYKTSQSLLPVPVFLETVSVEFHWSFLSYGNWEWGVNRPLRSLDMTNSWNGPRATSWGWRFSKLHTNLGEANVLSLFAHKQTRVQLIWLPFPPTLNQNHICYLSMIELMSLEYCGSSENCSRTGDCHLGQCVSDLLLTPCSV